LDPSRFERTEAYFPKRVAAYLLDGFIVFAIFTAIFYLAGAFEGLAWLEVLFISGIVLALLKAAFDYTERRTPGRVVFGLRLRPLREELSLIDAFVRNASCIVPVILPMLDMLFGFLTSPDDRQKWLDNMTHAIVVEDMPVEAREVFRRPMVQVEQAERPERFRLGFDQGYARGNCPRCGAPYRVLPPGDQRFNGLWNHRCTWCNSLIQEGL
jgi:uncharacterized RDD family membrane protein YckC